MTDDDHKGWLGELRATDQRTRQSALWASGWFFCVLLSYFVIRPVRETMGTSDPNQLRWLFLGTFVAMLIAVPVYSYVVAIARLQQLINIVYRFFMLNLVMFVAAMWLGGASTNASASPWIARIFFVWVSVFSLFNTSVFWSVLADIFNSEQAKRLFGLIAACGTAGAICGSFISSVLATKIGVINLLWIPIVTIECGLFCATRMLRAHASRDPSTVDSVSDRDEFEDSQAAGGGVLDGVLHVFSSPYLALICIFLLFNQFCGTHFYFVQADLVHSLVEGDDARAALFGKMNLYTQICTLALQSVVFGTLLRRLGLSIALMVLPLIYLGSFIGLAILPTIAVLVIADVARRSIAYGITVPGREVLFTVVSREDKYKSKAFIDTVVLRGGDTATSQAFAIIKGLNVSLAAMNLAMIPVTLVWGGIACYLGVQQQRRAANSTTE